MSYYVTQGNSCRRDTGFNPEDDNDKAFKDFILVGGTALSLQIGHRISVDIDLFSSKPFDSSKISNIYEKITIQKIPKH